MTDTTHTTGPQAAVSATPELDKLAEVKDATQAAGDFIEWAASQGVHLMTFRTDLTDVKAAEHDWCRPDRSAHCTHFDGNPEHDCCHCRRDHKPREVTGIKAWVSTTRDLHQLLADWQGIDQRAVEREKRQILANLHTAGGAA